MTLGAVRDFFRKNMAALKYKEWTDAFEITNIPSTILDGSFHLTVGHIQIRNTGAANGRTYDVAYPITLRVLSKGYANSAKAIDGALDNAQDILEQIISAVATLDQIGLKHVRPTGLDTQPLQLGNERAVILVMQFDAALILGF